MAQPLPEGFEWVYGCWENPRTGDCYIIGNQVLQEPGENGDRFVKRQAPPEKGKAVAANRALGRWELAETGSSSPIWMSLSSRMACSIVIIPILGDVTRTADKQPSAMKVCTGGKKAVTLGCV